MSPDNSAVSPQPAGLSVLFDRYRILSPVEEFLSFPWWFLKARGKSVLWLIEDVGADLE
jgi:hypothetical protein